MQTLRTLALISAAIVGVACAKDSTKSAVNNDLKRDLELAASSATDLASAQNAATFSPTELGASSAPTVVSVAKKGNGNKVMRSKHPTVRATQKPELAQSEVPEVKIMSQAPSTQTVPVAAPEPEPSPSEGNDLPAVPRPTPASIPVGYPTGQGPDGSTNNPGSGGGGNSGGGIGAVLGGIFGAVIRGGVVDGDRCEPHGRDGRRYPGGGRRSRGGFGAPGSDGPLPTSPGIPTRGRIYLRVR